jgi:hypothetical protein
VELQELCLKGVIGEFCDNGNCRIFERRGVGCGDTNLHHSLLLNWREFLRTPGRADICCCIICMIAKDGMIDDVDLFDSVWKC